MHPPYNSDHSIYYDNIRVYTVCQQRHQSANTPTWYIGLIPRVNTYAERLYSGMIVLYPMIIYKIYFE